MNRAERRQQARSGQAVENKLNRISRQGASVDDLKRAYKDINAEIRSRLEALTREQLKDFSAAALVTLMESGNSRESCIDFVKNTIITLQGQIDKNEIGERLLYDYGIHLDFDDALEPVKLNPNWKPDNETKEHPQEQEQLPVWKRENTRPCSTVFVCSKCGGKSYDLSGGNNSKSLHGKSRKCTLKYCPNCGIKMEVNDVNTKYN